MIASFMSVCCFEFFKESDVVLGEHTQVANAILQVCNSLNAHTEGIAAVNLRVNTALLQYVRIYHATAKNLYPACVLAESTTLTTTDEA